MKFLKELSYRKILKFVEYILCIVVLIAVLAGIPDLFKYIIDLIRSSQNVSYKNFAEFLRHVLILVVGIELIYMILSHKMEAILSLILFVIARKMLVYADTMFDMLLGSVSVVLIFLAYRFLSHDEFKNSKLDGSFQASISLTRLREDHHIDLGNQTNTLGGLVFELSEQYKKPIQENMVFEYNGYILKIVKVSDGVIDRVSIKPKKN